jgi:DNA-binding transcriptional LysR family regulator
MKNARTINANLLRTFTVVAETRHFTGAAQRLNSSQSAVSMQIQRLEDDLQVRLLKRSKRDVHITPEGEILLRYAHRVMRLTDEALTEMGRQVAAGKVRFGATDMSMCYLPKVLQQFYAYHPLIDVELRCSPSWETLAAYDAGDIDIAFVTQCGERKGGRLITHVPLVWACAVHSDADDRDPAPLAVYAQGCIYRKAAIEALEAQGKAFRLAYESPSRAGLDCAVAAGLAVTMTPQDCIADNLRVIEPRKSGFPALPKLKTYMFGPSSKPPVAVKAFSDQLVQTLSARSARS